MKKLLELVFLGGAALAIGGHAQAQAAAGAAAVSPLPAGSAWIGTLVCGADRWDAALRVDAADNRRAELLAVIDRQTRTIRMNVAGRGQGASFDMTPVDPPGQDHPFEVVSGTMRQSDSGGPPHPIISWRPVDGSYPKCRVAMRFSPGALPDIASAGVGGVTRIFGLSINAPLEVPTCKVTVQQVRKCSPSGLSCWNEAVRVQEQRPVCFVPDRSHIRFDPQHQPAWASGPIGVRLDRQNRLVHVEFQAAKGTDVLRELHTAFGAPARIEGRDRSQGALASCLVIDNVVDCAQVRQAREWTEYTQVWRTSAVEARFDEGSNRAAVTSLVSR